ncbi:unnamed protein product [Acanthoscelides obtectus]|uniref:Uncharacterized protein n=1 Tax=Acanthoscelides obtectus TaxID=200917 RepID=A0A9P0LGZ6_ACAOB|nr:unnamed protein product [Acanthoscelides obtectus]CAK1635646.1 hypothetical protein AOBTE_LOCUS9415 [Acanthoscelides obtectus]
MQTASPFLYKLNILHLKSIHTCAVVLKQFTGFLSIDTMKVFIYLALVLATLAAYFQELDAAPSPNADAEPDHEYHRQYQHHYPKHGQYQHRQYQHHQPQHQNHEQQYGHHGQYGYRYGSYNH